MRTCSQCGESKDNNDFYKTKGQCKVCILKKRAAVIRHRTCLSCDTSKPHTQFPKMRRVCLVCLGEAEEEVDTVPVIVPEPPPVLKEDTFPLARVKELLRDIRCRAALLNVRRFHEEDYKNDLDVAYCRRMWEAQGGRCALSGLPMTGVAGGGRGPDLCKLSIDRVDSGRNYSRDNVQLVCLAVNMMKSTFTSEEFLFFAGHVHGHSKRKVIACEGRA